MTHAQMDSDLYIDANGCLAERFDLGDSGLVIHYDDLPETDVTTVNGLRVTTPLRTVIDLAPELGAVELDHMVRHCLDRRLFSIDEARRRVAQPDMRARFGAQLLRRAMDRL